MKPIAILGVLLIAIGVAGLLIANISFTEKKVVVDAGPLKITADQQRTIPIPSIAGVIAVVVGAGLLLYGRKASS
jgi:Flp pilus assembly protein CpaB